MLRDLDRLLAEDYANHFIAVHLKESGGGLTYAQLSTKARANPDDAKLKGQVDTAFRGETLRGLLLNAYAFGTMGRIAGFAAIGALIGAGVMLILSLLGRCARTHKHVEHVEPADRNALRPVLLIGAPATSSRSTGDRSPITSCRRKCCL